MLRFQNPWSYRHSSNDESCPKYLNLSVGISWELYNHPRCSLKPRIKVSVYENFGNSFPHGQPICHLLSLHVEKC
jgi:hypothetical protein